MMSSSYVLMEKPLTFVSQQESHDLEKESSRSREKDRDKDCDRHREKDREREKSRDRDREKSKDRDIYRERDRHRRDRHRDRSRERSEKTESLMKARPELFISLGLQTTEKEKRSGAKLYSLKDAVEADVKTSSNEGNRDIRQQKSS